MTDNSVKQIKDMQPEPKEYTREELFYSSATGVPKHSRKEYNNLNNKMTASDVIKNSVAKRKR